MIWFALQVFVGVCFCFAAYFRGKVVGARYVLAAWREANDYREALLYKERDLLQ